MIAQFIKNKWYLLSIVAIILIAGLIRFYGLGVVPHGMTWDEAAIGYNGMAVLTTRRDEWLHRLPISFQSFGDYKAPLAIYINGPFTYLFGMNLFAVRLPFVISSLFGILGIILLTKLVFEKHKLANYYSLFAGMLLTLSPWHIHYSRTGFESGMALTLLIWALFFTLYTIDHKFKKIIPFGLGILSFVLSLYTYHSAKVVVPLLLIILFILFFKSVKENLIKVILAIFGFVILLLPMIKDSIFGEGLTRAGVTIFSEPKISLYQKFEYVFQSFATHLSPNFLLFGDTTTLRHGTGFMGVLFITTFLLVILGIFFFTKKMITKNNKSKKIDKYQLLFLLLILVGLLPASIALEVPHSNRALLALPGFIITAVYGLDYLITILEKTRLNKEVSGSHQEKNILVKSAVGIIIFIHILLGIAFINKYFSQFSRESADQFLDGYLEAFELTQKYEKGLDGYQQVEKIIFTSDYGQPYIYALFARETNPIWYRGGSLIKYEFNSEINIGDLQRNNALVVGSNTDLLPVEKADHIIYGSDGQMRFQIYKTENK